MGKQPLIRRLLPLPPPINSKFHANDNLHGDGAPAVIYPDGTRAWFRNGLLHRDGDEPAVEWGNGELRAWLVNGQLHRDGDKPALITRKKKAWFKHGKRHRDGDMPAVVWHDLSKLKWYSKGKPHRARQCPAVLILGKCARFCVHGQLHRLEGPAIICWEHGIKWYRSGRPQHPFRHHEIKELNETYRATLTSLPRTLREMQETVKGLQGVDLADQEVCDRGKTGLPIRAIETFDVLEAEMRAEGHTPAVPEKVAFKHPCTCRVKSEDDEF